MDSISSQPTSLANSNSAHRRSRHLKNILIVDSKPAILRLMENTFSDLTKKTWNVFPVHSYDAVVPLLVEHWIDAIILDMDMPGEDGTEFVHLLHSNFPTIPTLALTEIPVPSVRAKCMEKGAVAYLEKPRSTEETSLVFSHLCNLLHPPEDNGFRGVLWVSGLLEILQLICLNRHSSILEVTSGSDAGRVFINGGEIIHARIGFLEGTAALTRILSMKGGEFSVSRFVQPRHNSIHGAWETILLEAAYQEDERLATTPSLPASSVLPVTAPPVLSA